MNAAEVVAGWRSLELAMHDACAGVDLVDRLRAFEKEPLDLYNACEKALDRIEGNRRSLEKQLADLRMVRDQLGDRLLVTKNQPGDFDVCGDGCVSGSLVWAETMGKQLLLVLAGAVDAVNRIQDEALTELQRARGARAGAR